MCEALDQILARHGAGTPFTVDVRVEPRSILTAVVTLADGHRLPALHMAEMDRPITRNTLDRFASAIADHAASGVR